MDVFAWYLVISMVGTDEILVKQMESKAACVKAQQQFLKKGAKKFKNLADITCEEGLIFEQKTTTKEETL